MHRERILNSAYSKAASINKKKQIYGKTTLNYDLYNEVHCGDSERHLSIILEIPARKPDSSDKAGLQLKRNLLMDDNEPRKRKKESSKDKSALKKEKKHKLKPEVPITSDVAKIPKRK